LSTRFRFLGVLGALGLVLALVAGSCSDDDKVDSGSDSKGTTTTTAADGQTEEAKKRGCPTAEEVQTTLTEVEGRGEPQVTVPPAPATELKTTDLVAGTGPAVAEHNQVYVHYTGVGQSSGKTFDSSWTKGEPAEFNLDQVIPGWSEGLVGMKVGGRREIVIPGEQAYGAQPPSADIAANETLVFVVDMIATC